jgi:hypothetical protein
MIVAGGVEAAFLDANRMRLVDRQALTQVLREQDLSLALSDSQVSRVGKAIAADALLTGTLTMGDKCLVGEVRLTSVRTGELLAKVVFEWPTDAEIMSLLAYVQRPRDKGQTPGELPPLTLYYDILAQRETRAGQFEEIVVRGWTSLRSGDQYRMQVHAGSDCYLYVITYDSQGDVYVLFPHARIKQGNFIRGGYTYTIPGASDPWYTLDNTPGKETLVFVASYEPLKDLDRLLSTMKTAGAVAKDQQESVRQEVAKLSRTRGAEDCVADGFKVSNTRGTVLDRPKANYALTGGRNVEQVMRVAEGTDRVVQTTTFNHDR